MISSRKQQLSIALILVFTFTLAFGTEPNEAKTGLKFEISDHEVDWIAKVGRTKEGKTLYRDRPGPIKPTHAAELFIKRKDINRKDDVDFTVTELTKAILESTMGRSMSQEQRDFLATEFALLLDSGRDGDIDRVPNYYDSRLYAVSEDDAKKMAHAFIEFLTNRANAKMQSLLTRRQELQEKIAEIKKQISKMEAEIKNAQPNLDRLKKETQYLHSGKAEEAISEFNKMLNTLKIELSGIRSRLQTIEIYKAKLGKEISDEHRFKLEQMFIEQMIELKAGEARKNTVIDLRNEARSFYNLDQKLDKLKSTKYNLGNDLTRLEPVLGQIEEKLANPTPDMLPPKVLQNKVTIYPVRAGE